MSCGYLYYLISIVQIKNKFYLSQKQMFVEIYKHFSKLNKKML